MKDKIKSLLLYDGLSTKKEYDNVVGDIKEQNRLNMLTCNLVLCGLFTVLFSASFFIDAFIKNRQAYLICAIIFAVFSVILFHIKGMLLANTFMTYLFLTIIGGFTIFIGSINSPDKSAVAFNIFLVLMPLMAYDRALRSIFYRIIMCIVYVICLYKFKEFNLATEDVINAICYCFIGIVIGIVNQKTKTSAYYLR